MRARRTLLYVPGDDLHKMQKAAGLGADCVCLDLEDGVAQNRKGAARETIRQALQTIDFGKSERLVRVNPLRTGATHADLRAVLPGRPDGIVLPKVESGRELKQVERWISAEERRNRIPAGSILLIAIVETAAGFLRLEEIGRGSRRLRALIFGGEDLAADLGAQRTRSAEELFTARSLLVLTAAACGLQAIDLVSTDFKDLDWLFKEARQGAGMGFAGKQVIHPAQIEPVTRAFTPGEDEIRDAEEILRLNDEHQAGGKGAFAMDGKMVDMPVVKRARNVLLRAGKMER